MAEQEAVETTEETVEATEETNETAETTEESTETKAAEEEAVEEDISYHAVEKDGQVTAIWETQGKKHLRTISPRSEEGKHILALFETAEQ
jgi:hypothetical protein